MSLSKIQNIAKKTSNCATGLMYYTIPFECPDCRKWMGKDSRQIRRKAIISFFSDDEYHPRCAICGDDEFENLELDHIDGNGKKERLERKKKILSHKNPQISLMVHLPYL